MAALDFPTSPTVGQIYTANGKSFEWNGTSWINKSGMGSTGYTGSMGSIGYTGSGGGGAVASGAIYENSQTITANYTITSGKNAMSAGPITINTGITVTVPSGSAWTIV